MSHDNDAAVDGEEVDSWLDEKLLPLDKWDPVIIHQPTPLPTSSPNVKSQHQVDTLHGYKSSMKELLANILSLNGWHEPLLIIIIDYITTFTLPLIGRHIMTLEHASARGEGYDQYDSDNVTSQNGYYYLLYGGIIVSFFDDPSH
jgi:hypothetical protein